MTVYFYSARVKRNTSEDTLLTFNISSWRQPSRKRPGSSISNECRGPGNWFPA